MLTNLTYKLTYSLTEDNMKKLITLALCLASLSFFGCAKAGLKNVDPSWTEPANAITVLYTQPLIKNTDDVADDLPDYANDFSGWFTKQMSSEFASQAGITPTFTSKEIGDFTMTNTKFGKKEFLIPSPKFDEIGEVDGVVIAMSNIEVARISETKMTGPTSAETRTYLQFSGEYSISNMANKTVVTSGTFKAREGIGFAMTKSNWEANMKNLVEEILKDTPLKKK